MNSMIDLPDRSYDRRTSFAKHLPPFHCKRFQSIKDAFQHGFNEHFWRHGIVISQGNGMSISKEEAVRRLSTIRRHLGRAMFGNLWRQVGLIRFVLFQHGSRESDNLHFHALLGIGGEHNWSDFRIAMEILSIENERRRTAKPWEKPAHVDWNWDHGNRYHSYVSRFANKRPDDWEII
jgi:hypothetical protein